jgi:LacI family transcriptional regulator
MPNALRIAVVEETFCGYGRALIRGVASYVDRGCPWELHTLPLGKNGAAILNAAMLADGVITRPYTPEMLGICRTAPKPTVAVHYRGSLDIPSVVVNPDAVVAMALQHLSAQGFRQFAFFGVPEKSFSVERSKAFARWTTARGLVGETFLAGDGNMENFNWTAPNSQVVRWLAALPKPIGILAANDYTAQQLLLSAPPARVRIPDEVAVVGVDNDETICRVTTPQLSSIDGAGDQAGFAAAAMLDQLLTGRRPDPLKVHVNPTRLVVRQSSDTLAVKHPDVRAAIRFICSNIKTRLGVEDVVCEVAVARRTLELAFKKLLGHSIHDEITHTRIRRAKQLLIESDLNIPDIAEACAFSNRAHLSDVFKRHTGHAPAEFRRTHRVLR